MTLDEALGQLHEAYEQAKRMEAKQHYSKLMDHFARGYSTGLLTAIQIVEHMKEPKESVTK